MSKLERLQLLFWQRFSVLKSSDLSEYLFAEQLAKYELFCAILKQFILYGQEQPARKLLDVVFELNDDFLLQVMGLPHLSERFRKDADSVTKTDLAVFGNFMAAHCDDIFIYEKESIRFADQLPHLDVYYKSKSWFDQDLVWHLGAQSILRKNKQPVKEKISDSFSSARWPLAEELRVTIVRQYFGAFEARVNLSAKSASEEEEHLFLDRTLADIDRELEQLWPPLRAKLEVLQNKFARQKVKSAGVHTEKHASSRKHMMKLLPGQKGKSTEALKGGDIDH